MIEIMRSAIHTQGIARAFILSFFLIVPGILHLSAPPSASQENDPEWVLKLAAVAPEGTSWSDTGYKFKQYVEEKSGGRVRVIWYLGGIMGDEPDVFLKMRLGYLQGGGFTVGGLGTMVPEIHVLILPFLFENYEELDYLLEKMNYRFQILFEKRGFVLAGWLEAGLHYWYAQKPVRNIEDFKKSRVWAWKADPVNILTNQILGFQNFQVGFPNVLSALQTGLIDAFYCPTYASVTLQWYTKAKYLISPHFSYAPAAIVLDKKFFDGLPPDIQRIIMAAWEKYLPALKETIREDNKKALTGMIARGMKQITLDNDTVEILQRITRPVYQKSAEQFFPEWLLREVLTHLKTYRDTHPGKSN